MTQQSQFMLMFSLGPVQTFIAQARKTRDLWLGSYLLARLMEAAMKGMDKILVYPTNPTLETGSNVPDLPNKYVALFYDLEAAKEANKNSQQDIYTCWKNICNDVWEQTIKKHPPKQGIVTARGIWNRQTNPEVCFDVFWVIVEKNSAEDYGAWLKRTEDAFDARKRLRDFKIPYNQDNPSMTDEQGEKSTISGEREALRGEETSRESVRAFWKDLSSHLSSDDINPNGKERLDAIDMVKRFAYRAKKLEEKRISVGFPSTSSITTASYIERLLTAEIEEPALRAWLNITNRDELRQSKSYPRSIPYFQQPGKMLPGREEILQRDGDLYFPETFTAYRLKEDYNFPYTSTVERQATQQYADRSSRALKALLEATDRAEITRPTPYYAMIQMDGDQMGKLLGKVTGDTEHRAISEALSQFSRGSALDIVEKQYPARLVYAGGDDVFALAPLARDIARGNGIVTVLDLVDELQQEYHNRVAQPVSDQKRKQGVTASIGIAIAHHYTSLSYVRRMAKAAEELAKEHYGRDALVVTVIRRSGEQTRVGCHWRYPQLTMQPIELFTYFYELFKYDLLSPKCVFTLLEEAPALVKLEKDAQKSEIRRVLLRQSSDGKQKGSDKKKEIERLAEHLVNLAEAMDDDDRRKQDTIRSVELHSDQRRYGLVELLGWLLVAAFLARKEQE